MLLVTASAAHAQQFDLAFGVGTVTGTAASEASAGFTAQSIGGGAYPVFSGDFLFFHKYFGIGAEATYRAHQNVNLFFQPYRPILYDVNAVFAPPLGKKAQAELQGAIGSENPPFFALFSPTQVVCAGAGGDICGTCPRRYTITVRLNSITTVPSCLYPVVLKRTMPTLGRDFDSRFSSTSLRE